MDQGLYPSVDPRLDSQSRLNPYPRAQLLELDMCHPVVGNNLGLDAVVIPWVSLVAKDRRFAVWSFTSRK